MPKRVHEGVPSTGETASTDQLPGVADLGEDGAVVASIVADLAETADGPVAYDRVIQRARREYGMARPDVERTVECLVADGVLEKERADRLTVT